MTSFILLLRWNSKKIWNLISGGCNKQVDGWKITTEKLAFEGNKLQNLYSVLIIVTQYSKLVSETATAWLFLSCYMSVNSFLLLCYFYLGVTQKFMFCKISNN